MIHIRTLGAAGVDRDGVALSLRRKDVLLLAYLALHERPVTRVSAASLLWGETTDHAARLSLRQAVWRLRNELGDAVVATTTTLAVDAGLVHVDVRDLEAHVEAGRYRDAVLLAGGEFLDGVDAGVTNEFELWVDDVRARVRQRLGLARQQMVRDAVRIGDWDAAARHAASWSRESPWDATPALELARALRANGHAAEALAGLTAFVRNSGTATSAAARADIEQLSQSLRQEAERPAASATPEGQPSEDPHVRLVTLCERCAFGKSAGAVVSGSATDAAQLARAFLEWVEARGAGTVILRATATRADSGIAWQTLRSLIDGLRSAPGVGGAANDAVTQVAAWSPALRDRFPRLKQQEADGAAVEDALRRVLDAVAEEATIIVCVENAHNCDAESAAVIAAFMKRLPARTLFLATVDASSETAPMWAGSVDDRNIIRLPRRSRSRRALLAAAAVFAFVAVATGAILMNRSGERAEGPIAVGIIQVVGERDTLSLSGAVPGLLASKIGLIPELEVISSARMYEVRAQLGTKGDGASTSAEVARRAGARTLIEGEIYRQNGEMRLALRRVRLSTGKVEASYESLNTNVFTLVDDIADQIARSYNVELPRQRINGATTTSIVAYKFYEEGLRAYYQNDHAAANRDFLAALEQDSTFAMAAYYASQSDLTPDISGRMFKRAVRLAETAGDRDRLLIQAQWAVRTGARNLFAIADTLTVRYPHDPDGHYYYGLANISAGRFDIAARELQQAITLDSLALLGHTVPCRACESIYSLLGVYELQDSLRAAERIGREWVQLQPWSTTAWEALAGTVEFQGRFAAADSFYTHAESVQPDLSDLAGHVFELAVRAGKFTAADSIVALGLRSEDGGSRANASFRSLMSDRAQGRMRAAFATATRLRMSEPDSTSQTGVKGAQARAFMELGRFREGAALYDSIARVIIRTSIPTERHNATQLLAAEAVARAAGGDTTGLASLEAEVKYYGNSGVLAREQVLHHYVHGLRQQLAGDLNGAIISFRKAIYSPTFGNVRASLSLGRALVARNRAAEAIPVLEAAVRGALGASGTAVPKAELHEALGEAYEAHGDRVRAAAEYSWVLNAWRHADHAYDARRAQLQQRLQRLGHAG